MKSPQTDPSNNPGVVRQALRKLMHSLPLRTFRPCRARQRLSGISLAESVRMTTHLVQQGECLSSLAARYRFSSWQRLYEDPQNAELKKTRSNPNVLAPGDQVVIPDIDVKSVPVPTEHSHVFKVRIPKVKLRVAIVDRSGKPYAGKRFIVNTSTSELRGTTAPDGMVEVRVPAVESAARLRVWLARQDDDAVPTIDRELTIGHIDPINAISGVQGRLSNLAYNCTITNEVDDKLLSAVRSFRAKHGLPEIDRPESEDDQAADEYAGLLMDEEFHQKLLTVYESRQSS